MKIEYLRIKNFKVFRDVELKDIPSFCVMIGANGSGKSTLFSVFGFLKDSFESNVTTALLKMGGIRSIDEVRSRGQLGNIEIELKFRIDASSPLITYSISIGQSENQIVVEREILRYRRGSKGIPWHFLDFTQGKGWAVTNELGGDFKDSSELVRSEQVLKSPDILAIKGLSQFEQFPAVKALGELIENWHVSDFHISKARTEPTAGYAEHLSREGENIALVTDFLYKQHKDIFDQILKKLRERVPGITNVEAKITEEGRVLLRFRDGAFHDPFLARYVSDGTIKMFAYLVLLYDPKPHHLLCVEEPENQLYSKLLWELAEEFRDYANRGGQVFVSTHSPDFLNAVHPDEIFLLMKENGYTKIKKASDDEQIKTYVSEGDQMGYLWKQGLLEGVDTF